MIRKFICSACEDSEICTFNGPLPPTACVVNPIGLFSDWKDESPCDHRYIRSHFSEDGSEMKIVCANIDCEKILIDHIPRNRNGSFTIPLDELKDV